MEELADVLKNIKNYADLNEKEKQLALEAVYRKQRAWSHSESIIGNQNTCGEGDEKETDGGGKAGEDVAEDGKEGAYRVQETRFKGKHRSIRDW